MTPDNTDLESIIRSLIKCLTGEAEAIAERDFSSIAEAAQRKISLAAQFEAAVIADAKSLDDALTAALREMQTLAYANAVRLQNLRNGAARAHGRIQELIAEHSRLGVYQAKGLPIKLRPAAGSGRSA